METDLVLVVNPAVPAQNVAELLALARAKPGTLNFGSSGPGSNYHMAAELLKTLTGIDIVHVPYKGSTGMRIDILSGQIQILFDAVPTMAPYIKAGKVRALGTTGANARRSCPTYRLSPRRLPGFEFSQWVGFMAPKATPRRSSPNCTRHHRHPEPPGHQELLGDAGRRAHGDVAAAIRRLHAGPGR